MRKAWRQGRLNGPGRKAILRRNPERGWGLIDEVLANVGKIRSKKRPGEEGYYGELFREANRGAARRVFAPTGQSPDSATDALRRSGVLGDDASVDDLWDGLARAAKARAASRRADNPERQLERFSKVLTKQERARCKKLVASGELAVGDRRVIDSNLRRVGTFTRRGFGRWCKYKGVKAIRGA